MKGIVINYRGSQKTQNNHQMIVKVPEVADKEKAAKLVGKEVVWTSPKGKDLIGKASATHGNKGCIRVIFEKGLPGQSIGTKVEVKA